MSEQEERDRMVEEALTWVGTKYENRGRVKGKAGGVDCLTLLLEVAERSGITGHIPTPKYPPDWHMHREDPRYLTGVLQFCKEVDPPPIREPKPGDVVLWKFGLSYSHGGIVIAWPVVIHAYNGRSVGKDDASRSSHLKFIVERTPERGQPRPRRHFTLKDWT